jgi:hypothetical protein
VQCLVSWIEDCRSTLGVTVRGFRFALGQEKRGHRTDVHW